MRIALFDFDGTIADSAPTIMAAASTTLSHFGYPVPPEERLHGFVGPPLPEGITDVLGLPPELVPEFRTRYRATYVEHMTEAPPFPGIPALLTALAEAGWVLGVASSKREDLVVRILAAQGLGDTFAVVAGADRTERNAAKSWVVGRALAGLAETGVDGSGAILVGDRHHDVEGAAEHGLRTIFAAWGYGAPWESEGAWAVAESPAALGRLLLG